MSKRNTHRGRKSRHNFRASPKKLVKWYPIILALTIASIIVLIVIPAALGTAAAKGNLLQGIAIGVGLFLNAVVWSRGQKHGTTWFDVLKFNLWYYTRWVVALITIPLILLFALK